MSTTNRRRGRPPAGTGLGVALAAAAGLLVVGPAAAQQQDCRQELQRIEAQMAGAELTRAQRDYIRDLIDSARTLASDGDLRGCRRTIADLAEYTQEEAIAVPVARRAGDPAFAVPDTPETLRDKPAGRPITVPDLGPPRVGETSVPLPVPAPEPDVTVERTDPKVRVERAEPRVEVERAEPRVSVEQAEPNVTIEQAEPRVIIERMGAGG